MLHVEPQAGPAPVTHVIEQAQNTVEMNVYEISSERVLKAIRVACHNGVNVRVMYERHPYHGGHRVAKEKHELGQTCAQTEAPPQRFEQKYVFDHAKYIVADPGTHHGDAELGTANFSWHAFHKNREYLLTTHTPAIVKALNQVFDADWNRQQVPQYAKHQLVLSPHAGGKLQQVIDQPGTVGMEAEEVSGPKPLLNVIANKGSKVHMIVPSSISGYDKKRLDYLAHNGVRVRILAQPYMHAKVIIGQSMGFIGSQNLSQSSILENREVGVASKSQSFVAKIQHQFKHDWHKARPFHPQ